LKLLTNFENDYPPHWLQGKFARKTSMSLQNHRRLPVSIFSVKIAALASLKWITGSIFKISM